MSEGHRFDRANEPGQEDPERADGFARPRAADHVSGADRAGGFARPSAADGADEPPPAGGPGDGQAAAEPGRTREPAFTPPAPRRAYEPLEAPPGVGTGARAVKGSSSSAHLGPQYVLSGWWRRAGAALLDLLIIGSIALAVVAMVAAVAARTADGNETVPLDVLSTVSLLVVLLVAFLYAPVMMWKTNGRTVGRMATGIRVVRTSGEPMTFGLAAAREILIKGLLFGLVSQYTFGLATLVDVLWPVWDKENRALHDFPVNTRTVLD